MKKIMLLTAIAIVGMFVLTGCFFIDTSARSVRNAKKYIHEKYDNMPVEHVMVRGGKRNGYTSSGYYYTHWVTVNEPIVEFRVQEARTDFEPSNKKKGDLKDEYEIVLLEVEMKKRAEAYFDTYFTEFFVDSEVTGRGGYYTFVGKDEYLHLEQYLQATIDQIDEIQGWQTDINISVSYDEAKNISAEEMYVICQKLNDSGIVGYEPLIRVEIDKYQYIEDKEGNKVVDERQINFAGTAFPNKRYTGESLEEFISEYNYFLEREASR